MDKNFDMICVFEDEGYKNLLPLTYMRPTWGLRCGMTVLLEKILRWFPKVPFSLHCRDYLADTVKSGALSSAINKLPQASSCLFINGRVLARKNFVKKLTFKEEDGVLISENQVVAAKLSGKRLDFLAKAMGHPLSMTDFEPLKLDVIFKKTDIPIATYPWDLVHQNKKQTVYDFNDLVKGGTIKGDVHNGAYIYKKEDVFIDSKSEIMATVVLDARKGPIYIGKGVEIHPHTRIEGPAYIGDKTKVLGGKIRTGCSIGPMCKVGGEIEETIIQGYSNKQHDGFIGHSYICEWVNLGAGTTNSDLKNNYGNVKVRINGIDVDSKQTFVGSFIGDHSKTGIGTMLNTGTVIGVSSNIFGGGFPPKNIPSFSWGGEAGLSEYKLKEAVETARIVMGRRNKEMTAADDMLLRKIFDQTKEERTAASAPPSSANEI
jgi:UDP-N-acetylglucosamine diphosphorylase/glucosamine-1-phosphate N-acetyltransferase